MATGTSASDALADALLTAFLQGGTYTGAATVYLALCTSTGDGSAGATEVTGGSYARQPVTFNAPADATALGYPDARYCDNTADVVFPAATADWGLIVQGELWTGLTGGTFLAYALVPIGILVNNGQTLEFLAGEIVVILD